ncbi:hypothetical protein [Mycobacterium sp. E2238]|uniref:hypothetical protein n=1 Tax=Mycobacterium sp. E2238 TaxID=1834131 RepID=UPI001E3BCD9D|nr:hypothetical protein [Mycobacterium sp. E2238]
MFTGPSSRVATDTFSVENLLSRRREFVDRVQAGIRRIAVAAQLNGLHLCDLLRQRLLRCEDLVDLFVARIRYVCQPTS